MKILLILLFVSTPLMVVGQEPLTVVITLKAGNDNPTAEQVLEEGSLSPPTSSLCLKRYQIHE